ncbi:hypothetical protein Pmar_PMAR016244 [Perkinsus marinus ATCC 50983]|uniref:Uncharacterized protein n=1 Tax=Perkinsus marinus (strain ATCC 50983 / TXsc) TaxID=423536 RepID=C5KIY3_PERM5|nr:hypothetical protein Pmar_PMAR016244 [Perkinsus marinus ATCC 50983]EER15559.1 hypothetical protein Pmar_PMAR016244 [Perkinsus marinus ATCC 50983]|eukprot:XP_002783763.1 hypothetical protein Pmar_PMAR016244 [Perkinsus marinus ATCC 50983]
MVVSDVVIVIIRSEIRKMLEVVVHDPGEIGSVLEVEVQEQLNLVSIDWV